MTRRRAARIPLTRAVRVAACARTVGKRPPPGRRVRRRPTPTTEPSPGGPDERRRQRRMPRHLRVPPQELLLQRGLRNGDVAHAPRRQRPRQGPGIAAAVELPPVAVALQGVDERLRRKVGRAAVKADAHRRTRLAWSAATGFPSDRRRATPRTRLGHCPPALSLPKAKARGFRFPAGSRGRRVHMPPLQHPEPYPRCSAAVAATCPGRGRSAPSPSGGGPEGPHLADCCRLAPPAGAAPQPPGPKAGGARTRLAASNVLRARGLPGATRCARLPGCWHECSTERAIGPWPPRGSPRGESRGLAPRVRSAYHLCAPARLPTKAATGASRARERARLVPQRQRCRRGGAGPASGPRAPRTPGPG